MIVGGLYASGMAPVIPQLGDAAMGSRLWRGRLALSIKARSAGAEIFVIVPPLT
jgi:hypothetical protein